MTAGRLLAVPNDLLNLLPDGLQRYAQGFQGLGCYALTFVDEAEQDVFSPDVVVVQHPSLFLRQHNDAASSIRKPFEHVGSSSLRWGPAPA
jgi:hypothetical protein